MVHAVPGDLARGAALHLGGRAVEHDLALVDHDRARAHRLDLLEDVRREDDRAVAAELLDELAHLELLVRVESVGRLVEDEDARVVQQRLREAGAALVALRQRLERLAAHALEVHAADRALDAALRVGAAESARVRDEAEELLDRHVGVRGRALGQVAEGALGGDRVVGEADALELDGARGRLEEAGDHAHGGALARAVRPEEAEHLSRGDLEVDPAHRMDVSESLFEFPGDDSTGHRFTPKRQNAPREEGAILQNPPVPVAERHRTSGRPTARAPRRNPPIPRPRRTRIGTIWSATARSRQNAPSIAVTAQRNGLP